MGDLLASQVPTFDNPIYVVNVIRRDVVNTPGYFLTESAAIKFVYGEYRLETNDRIQIVRVSQSASRPPSVVHNRCLRLGG